MPFSGLKDMTVVFCFFQWGGVLLVTFGLAGFPSGDSGVEVVEPRRAHSPRCRPSLASHQPGRNSDSFPPHAAPGLADKAEAENLPGLGPRKHKLVQNVGLGKQRAGFTHVAMICDDVSLQPRLPQILIGNESLFPAATIGALQGTLPPNIHLWRRKSGWVTKGLMQEILKELCAALGDLLASRQVVLLLDTASVHICPQFLRAASRKGSCGAVYTSEAHLAAATTGHMSSPGSNNALFKNIAKSSDGVARRLRGWQPEYTRSPRPAERV